MSTRIYTWRWLRLVIALIVFGSLISSVVLYTSRSIPRLCLVQDYDSRAGKAYDPDFGIGISISNTAMYVPLNVRQASHNGKYVAYLHRYGIGSRAYRLEVQEIASGRVLFGVDNSAWMTVTAGLPGYDLTWSPDDHYVAFREDAPSLDAFIRVYSYDGIERYEINGIFDQYVWSPDSKSLVVVETPDDQRQDAILHFWHLNPSKITSYYSANRLIHAVAWSPTGDAVAYVQSRQDMHGPLDPYELVIASPQQDAIARTKIVSREYSLIKWSPDAHYLYLNGDAFSNFFSIEGHQITALKLPTNVSSIPFTQWIGLEALLYERNYPLTYDLVAYNPSSGGYRTILKDLINPPLLIIGSDDYLIEQQVGKLTNLIQINLTNLKSTLLIQDASTLALPSYTHERLAINWRSDGDPQGKTWISILDGNDFITLKHLFQSDAQLTILKSDSASYSEHSGAGLEVGVINLKSGDVYPTLHPAQLINASPVNSNQIIAEWKDTQNTTYFSGFDSEGKLLYQFPSSAQWGDAIPSEQGDRVITAVSEFDGIHDTGSWSLNLLKDGHESTLRSNLGAITDMSWAPDGNRFAAALTSFDNIPSLVIFDKDGTLQKEFPSVTLFPGRTSFSWLPCQSLDGDIQ